MVLSKREFEVVGYIARGATVKETAEKLNIAPATVNNAKANAYYKLGVHNVGELAVWWFCYKLGLDRSLYELKRMGGSLVCVALMVIATICCNDNLVRRSRRSRRRNEDEIEVIYMA